MSDGSELPPKRKIQFLPLVWDDVKEPDSKAWTSEPVGLYYHVFEAFNKFRASCFVDGVIAGKQVCETKEEAQAWCFEHYNDSMNKLVDHTSY